MILSLMILWKLDCWVKCRSMDSSTSHKRTSLRPVWLCSEGLRMGIVIGLFFWFCLRLHHSSFFLIISKRVMSAIGRKWKPWCLLIWFCQAYSTVAWFSLECKHCYHSDYASHLVGGGGWEGENRRGRGLGLRGQRKWVEIFFAHLLFSGGGGGGVGIPASCQLSPASLGCRSYTLNNCNFWYSTAHVHCNITLV